MLFRSKQTVQRVKMQYPDKDMIKSFLPIWAQSSVIGNVVGAIPGAGMTVAIFMAYDQVKRYRTDLEFGTGVPEGVAAPECANNAVVGSSMNPLLALGVPVYGKRFLHSSHGFVVQRRDEFQEAEQMILTALQRMM